MNHININNLITLQLWLQLRVTLHHPHPNQQPNQQPKQQPSQHQLPFNRLLLPLLFLRLLLRLLLLLLPHLLGRHSLLLCLQDYSLLSKLLHLSHLPFSHLALLSPSKLQPHILHQTLDYIANVPSASSLPSRQLIELIKDNVLQGAEVETEEEEEKQLNEQEEEVKQQSSSATNGMEEEDETTESDDDESKRTRGMRKRKRSEKGASIDRPFCSSSKRKLLCFLHRFTCYCGGKFELEKGQVRREVQQQGRGERGGVAACE
jgi:hypothetical protein